MVAIIFSTGFLFFFSWRRKVLGLENLSWDLDAVMETQIRTQKQAYLDSSVMSQDRL